MFIDQIPCFMNGAKQPDSESRYLHFINIVYVEKNRELCLKESILVTQQIFAILSIYRCKMLKRVEKKSTLLQISGLLIERGKTVNYQNDLNSCIRVSIVQCSLQHPPCSVVFLCSLRKSYQFWFSPSSLNLISAGPSGLQYKLLIDLFSFPFPNQL